MSDDKTADQKRDEVLKRMLQTKPKPHADQKREPSKPGPRPSSRNKINQSGDCPKAGR